MSQVKRSGASAVSRTGLGGCVLVILAGSSIALNRHLPVGSIADMGPGFMPLAVSLLLLACGVVIILRAITTAEPRIDADDIRAAPWRGILAVSLAIAVFALTVLTVGLFVSAVAMTLIAMLADKPFRPVQSIIYSIMLGAAVALIFIVGLKVPLPLWPSV